MTAPFPPTFVVGTGRCGSTLLSAMLRRASGQVASLSEVFSFATDLGGRIAESFPDGAVDGPAFWRIVAGAHPKISTLLRHGLVMDEVLYPSWRRRFTAEGGVPALLHTALPHLSETPEELYDALSAEVSEWPSAPVATHYRALFDWLAASAGRAGWVERSGGSLRIVARLARAFPDARFVHLVRDGRDCAVSMSRHFGFRMALVAAQLTEILGVDPYESPRSHVGGRRAGRARARSCPSGSIPKRSVDTKPRSRCAATTGPENVRPGSPSSHGFGPCAGPSVRGSARRPAAGVAEPRAVRRSRSGRRGVGGSRCRTGARTSIAVGPASAVDPGGAERSVPTGVRGSRGSLRERVGRMTDGSMRAPPTWCWDPVRSSAQQDEQR